MQTFRNRLTGTEVTGLEGNGKYTEGSGKKGGSNLKGRKRCVVSLKGGKNAALTEDYGKGRGEWKGTEKKE